MLIPVYAVVLIIRSQRLTNGIEPGWRQFVRDLYGSDSLVPRF
ncbi:MAG: hypothetical protein Ct9H300mP13_3050 [Gammaproteobacteria bacterium]|nr:MAG: hypothetical protein Ct9H300mP13_3050 [Gammaproteobacteria bacterium]